MDQTSFETTPSTKQSSKPFATRVVAAVAEEIAAELRREAKATILHSPWQIAERLGYEPITTRWLPAGVRAMSCPGDPMIVLAPCDYAPRLMLSVAHELVELRLRERGLREGSTLEATAQYGGAALILPKDPYLETLYEEGFDVAAMRRRWPFASWELIVRRTADLLPGVTAASWTDGALKFRHGLEAMPATGEHLERVALSVARTQGRGIIAHRGVRAMAWRLPRRGAQERAVSMLVAA